MAQWKEGDRVRVITRPVLAEDRRSYRYFDHMAGLTGTVANVYGPEEIAITVDIDKLNPITKEVHLEAQRRLREKATNSISKEGQAAFVNGEMEFDAHFVLLVRGEDLENA